VSETGPETFNALYSLLTVRPDVLINNLEGLMTIAEDFRSVMAEVIEMMTCVLHVDRQQPLSTEELQNIKQMRSPDEDLDNRTISSAYSRMGTLVLNGTSLSRIRRWRKLANLNHGARQAFLLESNVSLSSRRCRLFLNNISWIA